MDSDMQPWVLAEAYPTPDSHSACVLDILIFKYVVPPEVPNLCLCKKISFKVVSNGKFMNSSEMFVRSNLLQPGAIIKVFLFRSDEFVKYRVIICVENITNTCLLLVTFTFYLFVFLHRCVLLLSLYFIKGNLQLLMRRCIPHISQIKSRNSTKFVKRENLNIILHRLQELKNLCKNN